MCYIFKFECKQINVLYGRERIYNYQNSDIHMEVNQDCPKEDEMLM